MVQFEAAPFGSPRPSGNTTNAGRSSVRLPNPYDSQPPAPGISVELEPAVLDEQRGGVVGRVGDHRPQHGQAVGLRGDVRKQLRPPTDRSRRAAGTPSPACATARLGRRRHPVAVAHERPTVSGGQFRLVVERIDVRQSSHERDLHRTLGPRRWMDGRGVVASR